MTMGRFVSEFVHFDSFVVVADNARVPPPTCSITTGLRLRNSNCERKWRSSDTKKSIISSRDRMKAAHPIDFLSGIMTKAETFDIVQDNPRIPFPADHSPSVGNQRSSHQLSQSSLDQERDNYHHSKDDDYAVGEIVRPCNNGEESSDESEVSPPNEEEDVGSALIDMIQMLSLRAALALTRPGLTNYTPRSP